MRNKRGITLIALVITIIVLLILAAVSIQAITGDNGIATKAKKAKEQSEIGTEKEQIKLSYSSCKLDKIDDLNEEITASELEDKMNDSYGSGTVEVTGNGLLTVFYTETEREYLVLANGNTIVEADSIVENLTYENSVGIAEDGSLVDMTLWHYEYGEDIIEQESYNICWIGASPPYPGYLGEIVDGKIEGQIPAYILDLKYSEKFLPVTTLYGTFYYEELIYPPKIPSTVVNMKMAFAHCYFLEEAPEIPESVINLENTFSSCINLKKTPKTLGNATDISSCFSGCTKIEEMPEIPKSVIDMSNAFNNCSNLKKVSKIPNGVTFMAYTFSNCTSLTEAPEIPNTVTNMYGTFSGCANLVKAPIIPQNVSAMDNIFSGCNSLTGSLIINASPNYYMSSLYNVATNEGCELILSGSSTKLNQILTTKSANSNIRIGN